MISDDAMCCNNSDSPKSKEDGRLSSTNKSKSKSKSKIKRQNLFPFAFILASILETSNHHNILCSFRA